MDHSDIIGGYGERYARLYLFEPLNKLERMKKKDDNGEPIDMRGFGLLTLLFFFEQKIMRQSKVGKRELAQFLYDVTSEGIAINEEDYYMYAKTVIEAFRPGGGERDTFTFHNWETKRMETVSYQYLRASSYDAETQEQYYVLDEHGLELVFATKEFYSEFQLSISQLVLRKQLEKGEFKGALRQINEMRVAVESIESQLERLRLEIKRNIVSNEIFERYQKTIENTHYRLKKENEEFHELGQFVKEAKERLYYKDTSQKERNAYNLVLTISNELEAVHAYHTALLEICLQVKNDALDAAKESLYFIGVDSFNFDQDVLARIVSTPLPMDAMVAMLAPFLRIEQNKQWSLLTILGRQNVYEERETKEQEGFLQMDEREIEGTLQIARIYKGILGRLLKTLDEQGQCTLAEFIAGLEVYEQPLLESRYFYDFFLLLHQRSPIEPGGTEQQDGHLWSELHQVLENRTVIITEYANVLSVTDRFTIQNMNITLGGVMDEL